MKKNDIAIIVAVAIVAGIFSFVAAKMIFGGEKNYTLKAPEVKAITADFSSEKVSKYIKPGSIDLTKDITVQVNDNNAPFNGAASN